MKLSVLCTLMHPHTLCLPTLMCVLQGIFTKSKCKERYVKNPLEVDQMFEINIIQIYVAYINT